MSKFHVNTKTGDVGPCRAEKGQCPFGSADEHYDSPVEARQAYEMQHESFAVVVRNEGLAPRRDVLTFDARLETQLVRAREEFATVKDRSRWINDKVELLAEAEETLNSTAPGTPERSEALVRRGQHREQLLAADLVAWRDSAYYNASVEARMRATAVNVDDADSSIEAAFADEAGKNRIAAQYKISSRDVDNILEVAHRDYLRPRAPFSMALSSLADDEAYSESTAYVFRIEPETVRGVLSYAASYSQLQREANRNDVIAALRGV